MRFRALAAGVAFVSTLCSAAEPIRLQPSSKWIIDYAANSCRLIRVFGEGKDTTKLVFESEAPDTLDMLVFGKDLYSYTDRVPARFLPTSEKPMEGRSAYTTDKRQPAVLWSPARLLPQAAIDLLERKTELRRQHPDIRPPALVPAEEAALKSQRLAFADATTAIEIDARKNRPVILQTGSLGPALRAFDKCSRESLRDWGVDPDVEDKIVRPVWAIRPTQWIAGSDYPQNMVRLGVESDVKVRMLVDAAGRPTGCTSLSHFDAPEFNKLVCELLMRRAKLEPAELADGSKVPSYWVGLIRFRIAN